MSAPTTGLPFQVSRPLIATTFEELACHGTTVTACAVSILATPCAATAGCADVWRRRVRAGAAGRRTVRLTGADDCCEEPPSANTCSCDACPPFEEVTVPPTV